MTTQGGAANSFHAFKGGHTKILCIRGRGGCEILPSQNISTCPPATIVDTRDSITWLYSYDISGLISSVGRALGRALASKLRGPGIKSRSGTAGGPVTIIMWGARRGWKLALS